MTLLEDIDALESVLILKEERTILEANPDEQYSYALEKLQSIRTRVAELEGAYSGTISIINKMMADQALAPATDAEISSAQAAYNREFEIMWPWEQPSTNSRKVEGMSDKLVVGRIELGASKEKENHASEWHSEHSRVILPEQNPLASFPQVGKPRRTKAALAQIADNSLPDNWDSFDSEWVCEMVIQSLIDAGELKVKSDV